MSKHRPNEIPPSTPVSLTSDILEFETLVPETLVVNEPVPPPAYAPQTVMALTMEQLQSIINTAVTAAVQATGAQMSSTDLGNAIGAAIAKNAPRRKVTIGEYDPKTFVQPDKTKTLKLRRECFQNGGRMDPHVLSNIEIDGLNRITHSGRYINRLVEVVVGVNGSEEEVYLRYNNKTNDQRNTCARNWRSLADMLTQIVDEQEQEDKEKAATDAAIAELRMRAQVNA